VPTGGTCLHETETDIRLIIRHRQTDELYAFGLHWVIVDPLTNKGGEGRGDGRPDKRTIGLPISLVTAGGVHGSSDINIAQAILNNVRTVQHIEGGQPGDALVDGVLDRGDVVLILLVDTVVGDVNVGLPSQVVIRREHYLHLVTTADVRL